MKLHTLILLFLVIILFASIWGGGKTKKEKNRGQNKRGGHGDTMKKTGHSADDDFDDDYDYDDDDEGDDDDDEADDENDDYDDDDDLDEEIHWNKKRPCPKIKINCGPLPSVEHGTLTWNGTLEGDISTAECHPTYFMSSGSALRSCLNNCSWSGSDAVCTKIDCGNLADPDHGSVSQTGSKVFDVASYSCHDGYKLVPEVGCQRICLDSGNWSGFKPACIRACGPLSNPENGEVNVAGYTEGSFVTYTCDATYSQLSGSTKRTCTNGEWTGMPVVCSKVDCGDMLPPAYGSVSLTGTVYGDVATYSCNQHYILEGKPNSTCQGNGAWSNCAPVCTAIDYCSINPCSNGGACLSFIGGRSCTCPTGFSGNSCESMFCDFETGLCQWTQDTTDDKDWTRRNFGTPSYGTGPDSDHTTGGGYYIYIETSSTAANSTYRIISPTITSTPKCLRFWYHMNGRDINALNVYLKSGSNLGTPVWTKQGEQGNVWHEASVDIQKNTDYEIVFEGVKHPISNIAFQGDIALDDILVTEGSCTGAT